MKEPWRIQILLHLSKTVNLRLIPLPPSPLRHISLSLGDIPLLTLRRSGQCFRLASGSWLELLFWMTTKTLTGTITWSSRCRIREAFLCCSMLPSWPRSYSIRYWNTIATGTQISCILSLRSGLGNEGTLGQSRSSFWETETWMKLLRCWMIPKGWSRWNLAEHSRVGHQEGVGWFC